MISKGTALEIFHAYNEIEKAQALITELKAEIAKSEKRTDIKLIDGFGHRNSLTLGIPTSESGHRLLGVNVEMAQKIIECHIEDAQKKLKELMAVAKIELM